MRAMKRAAALALALGLLVLPAVGAHAEQEAAVRYKEAADLALNALKDELQQESRRLFVYRDFGDTENHFTQKALIAGKDASLVLPMDENWQEDPYSGETCIRCEQLTREGDWGGWLFLNGFLPENSSVPALNDGSESGQGLDLTGAKKLSFFAKGERGGEQVEFFTCGFGYDGTWNKKIVPWPDSSPKRSLGTIRLTDEWKEYSISLSKADLRYVVCGFGFVLSGGPYDSSDRVFYLDDIRFEGDFSGKDAHIMLRSYNTKNQYIRNAAFSYDNALAAMAFLSEGERDAAKQILDSFLYAMEHDRYRPGRVRNAYAAGDITAFPGWGDTARLPGWYDNVAGQWYEDRYQTGSNVGNTSFVALALLQYDALYGNESYLNAAAVLMDRVIEECGDENPGFTAGYDGWPESGSETTFVFTYRSIEHNIDAYAAFSRLYERTGEERYEKAAAGALAFVRSMYDASSARFTTGTLDDGVTPNTENTVLDAQVWACLALREGFAPYEASLAVVEKMRTEEGGYAFCLANANGGWWAEGTAYTALMYLLRGEREKAFSALDAMVSIQLENGLFPAATVENLSTGFELFDGSPWEYGTDLHLAPTAWFIMAVNGFDPYRF